MGRLRARPEPILIFEGGVPPYKGGVPEFPDPGNTTTTTTTTTTTAAATTTTAAATTTTNNNSSSVDSHRASRS